MIEILLQYGIRLITSCCFKETTQNKSVSGLFMSKVGIEIKNKLTARDPRTSENEDHSTSEKGCGYLEL